MLGTDVTRVDPTTNALLVDAFISKMRVEDVEEILALDVEPAQAVAQSIGRCARAWLVLFDGEPAYLYGYRPMETGVSLVWMLSAEACNRHPKAFLRSTRKELEALFAEVGGTFINMIDARHTRALRWAEWLGAEFGRAAPWGPKALPFIPFRFRR